MGEPKYKYVGEYVKSQFERGRNALEEGVYDRAIELFSSALRARGLNAEIEAEIRCSLSEAFEEDANAKQSLEAVKKYELLAEREILPPSLQTLAWLRMGLAYDRDPKAISYLNTSLKLAVGLNDPSAIGQAHLALGRSYLKVDEFNIARDHLEQAAESLRQVGDRRLLAHCYMVSGNVLLHEGKHDEAMELLESAERLISDRPYYSLLGRIMQNIAVIHGFRQRSQEAMAYQERSVANYERAGQRRYLVVGLNNLGVYLFSLGEVDRAQFEWERALRLGTELGHSTTRAMALEGLAQIEMLRGNYKDAEAKLESALEVVATIKSKWYEAQVRQTWVRLHCEMGHADRALAEAKTVQVMAEQIGDEHARQLAQLYLSEAKILNNEIEEARALVEEVDKGLEADGDLMLFGLSRRLSSKILAMQGHNEESIALAAQSASAFEALANKYQVGLSQFEWGKGLLATADSLAARDILQKASSIFDALGAQPDLERVKSVLDECEQIPKRRAGFIEFNLKSAERLLNAVIARELLIHELVSVLLSLPEVYNAAVFELSPATQPVLVAASDWTVEDAQKRLLTVRMNPSGVSPDGRTRLHWLEPVREGIKERTAVLVETEGVTTTSQIHLFLRLAQQGLELFSLRRDQTPKLTESGVVGNEIANSVGLLMGSAAMKQVLDAIHRIRSSDVTVLITGESGTGKELVARTVHAESARRDRAFAPFNCTTATRDLADSLLFGHRRGAFTGAGEDRQGVVRAADGGTLFLDEIGDLALEVQPKLLRFLQEGEVHPLGMERPIKVDVRIVAATNAELELLVEQGRFREDLFHRLNVIRLRVPALRERREEIPLLARHFLTKFAQENSKRLVLSEEATDLLQVYDWPGNVRQLSNEMRRVVALAEEGAVVSHQQLSAEIVGPGQAKIRSGLSAETEGLAGTEVNGKILIDGRQPMSDAVSQLERQMLLEALRRNSGNISKTARQLGLTRRGLHLKKERLGIQDFAEENYQ